jgi:hypothetical protein
MPIRTFRLLASLLLLAGCSKASRVELEPGTLRFAARGRTAKVHATPREKSGKVVPDQVCAWSSSDERVAKVVGAHNNAEVTSVGPGSAVVRCALGDLTGEVPVVVRVVERVTVSPERALLKMLDDPAPFALVVQAFDDEGAPVAGRVARVTCANEEVCRGDARGQLWGAGAGETIATVEVEGARAELPVKVVDARSAEARPKTVKGNPMDEIERAVRARDAAEARKR